ncbi:MAG: hypothetical protein RLP45_07190 [Haliea sp.]
MEACKRKIGGQEFNAVARSGLEACVPKKHPCKVSQSIIASNQERAFQIVGGKYGIIFKLHCHHFVVVSLFVQILKVCREACLEMFVEFNVLRADESAGYSRIPGFDQ